MVADTTYYELLGVSIEADEVEIKRAYKKKAMQHHPDKNPNDPLAHETFQRIGQAYEVLSHPDERAAYDRYGPSGDRGRGAPDPTSMDDLFASMFGFPPSGFDDGSDDDGYTNFGGPRFSFDPSGPSRQPRPSRGPDTEVRYEVTLEEVYRGKRVVMNLERDRTCGHCKGSGARTGAKPAMCGTCEGKGAVYTQRHLGPGLVGRTKEMCRDCEGEGTRVRDKDKCKRCKGAKVVKDKKRVEFEIEPGTVHGERIALKGEGDELPGVPAGDVIFLILYRSHSLFTRSAIGNRSDLTVRLRIRLSEALLGINRVMFAHLDGRGIRIVSPRGQRVIKDGQTFIVKGEGLPIRGRPGSKGDLQVEFEVEMPGSSWAARLDLKSDKIELPGALGDIEPLPAVVEERYLSQR